ncbi:hypothetical protein [Paraburkholderia flagellata]|nr:hypothetical protein [Paraburkholderia flagellata]
MSLAASQWNIHRDALTSAELHAMQALTYPASDPLYGERGPLIEYWLAQA